MDLGALVGGQVYVFTMILVRVGAAFMVMPIIGEQYVPANVRLLFAVLISMLTAPVLGPSIPTISGGMGELLPLVIMEILIGAFIGTLGRIILSALDLAGFIIANQLGLSAAQAFNPALASPGSPPAAIMGVAGLLLIMATDLHHMLILAVVDSYTLFTPGAPIPMGDMTDHIARLFGKSFDVGIQLSGPFVVVGFLFNLGLGLISRLVPQIQVFFVGLPVQLILGTVLFTIVLSAIMLTWLGLFEDQIIQILRL